jgi:hypothetical protein
VWRQQEQPKRLQARWADLLVLMQQRVPLVWEERAAWEEQVSPALCLLPTKDRSTYQPKDPSSSISLRNLRPPYSASHPSPRHHSTDRPSGRSGTRSPSASNTRQSDSRGTVQDRYERNRRIRANAPCAPPRGGHDAIRGNGRARRRGDGSDRYALVPLGATLSEFAEGNPSEIPSRT